MKNKPYWDEIIHWHFTRDGKSFYLCNQAVDPRPEKLIERQNKVSCKNCRKILGL